MKCLCWSPHHNHIIEWIDYEKRVEEIKRVKPEHEIPARLRSFQKVKSVDKIPEEVVDVCKDLYKAREAHDKALEALDKAREAYGKAREAYYEAFEAYYEAYEALDKAREAYYKVEIVYLKTISKHKEFLNNLYRQEVPDTAWDGERVVFEKGKKDKK